MQVTCSKKKIVNTYTHTYTHTHNTQHTHTHTHKHTYTTNIHRHTHANKHHLKSQVDSFGKLLFVFCQKLLGKKKETMNRHSFSL